MKKIISFLIFSLMILVFSVSADASLVAYWNFDETSGTVAHDSAGSYDGNLLGSASWSASGIAGGALSLNETSSDLVDMGNVLGFPSGDFSVVTWAKTSTHEPDTFILSKHQAGVASGYLMGMNQNGGSYGAADKAWFYNPSYDPGQSPISTTTVNDDAWHQIVAVHDDDGSVKIYVDGTLEDSKTSNLSSVNSGHFLIGGYTSSSNSNGTTLNATFTGLIDDVQIYDQTLTDAQINYLHTNPGSTVPIPGALWLLGSGLFGLVAVRRRKKA